MEDFKDWKEDGDTGVVDAVKGAMNELCQISMEAGDCLEQRKKEALKAGGGHSEELDELAGKMARVKREVSKKEARVSKWT